MRRRPAASIATLLSLLAAPPACAEVYLAGHARYDKGGPASGVLHLHLLGVADRVAADLTTPLGPEGVFAVALPPAAGDRLPETGAIQAEVVPGPAFPAVPARVAWRPGSPPLLDVALPAGVFIKARIAVPEGQRLEEPRALVAAARILPPAEGDPEAATMRLAFSGFRPVALAADGRLGPAWLDAAEAYGLVVSAGLLWGEWQWTAPELPPGSVWDVGTVSLEPAAAVSVEVERLPSQGFRVKPVRGETSDVDALETRVRALNPVLGEALFGDGRYPAEMVRPLLLAPLPAELVLTIVLEAPTGKPQGSVEVALQPGRVVKARLGPSIAPEEDVAGAALKGRVVWTSGLPCARAEVTEVRYGASVRADAEGRFQFRQLPTGEELNFRISARSEDGRERSAYQTLTLERDVPAEVAWTLDPQRWLRAVVPVPPEGGGGQPVAWRVEKRADDGSWIPAAAFGPEEFAGQVRMSVEEPGAYRLGVVWSSLFLQWTAPVELGVDGEGAQAAFEPPEAAVALEGAVLSAAGVPQAGVVVSGSGPIPGLPALSATTDRDGRFRFQPVNVPEVRLSCQTESGAKEAVVAARGGFVVLRLDEPPNP